MSIALTNDDRRQIGLWAADCAERVLPLFEAEAPTDRRPRAAIEAVRTFALDGRRTAQLRSAAWAGLAAAREVTEPAATAAARAASYAAATPYTHAVATPHQVRHVLSPALYQALARELAAGSDPAVGDGEVRWAVGHASPAVRTVVGRLPECRSGRTRLGALLRQLDAGLRR